MAADRRIVLVGIPGVGKTTLLTEVVKQLEGAGKTVLVRSFGTAMLEEAERSGIQDRDAIRCLPTEEQVRLQLNAAERIAAETCDVVIIDTHAFVNTRSGYYPGLPERVLRILNPTNYVSVSAKPEEIYNRRMNDPTRNRDIVSMNVIKQELDLQAAMVSACSVVSGSPVKPVVNREGRVREAANDVIGAIGL